MTIPPLCLDRNCNAGGMRNALTRGFIGAGICKECVIRKMPQYVRDKLPYLSMAARKREIRQWRDALKLR